MDVSKDKYSLIRNITEMVFHVLFTISSLFPNSAAASFEGHVLIGHGKGQTERG